tara:strand:- start:2321 stop:3304 length:984 start_codon:yes stop_codon:yes gene_type:complete
MKEKLHKKVFIGPMTLNVVSGVKRFNKKNNFFGLVPSRRQIECLSMGGGYVNSWSTKDFKVYAENTVVLRDHGGPGQGSILDDGLQSLTRDVESGINFIHIDPWKLCKSIDEAVVSSTNLINFCLNLNPDCYFEVGTESSIYPYNENELELFLDGLANKLKSNFNNLIYGVVQSGTQVQALGNIGKFEFKKSKLMCDIVHKFGLMAKEHNSDYLTNEDIKNRIDAGVDSFNIAPEFGVLETKSILSLLRHDEKLLKQFKSLAYGSKKWEKWVKHKPSVLEATTICGHYVLSTEEFLRIKKSLNNSSFDAHISSEIDKKLKKIYEATK